MRTINFISNKSRAVLTASTALVGVTIAFASPAYAADVTISTSTLAIQTMTNGETLSITPTGSVKANPAVRVPTNIIANKILNNGTMNGSYGLYVYNGGDISSGVDNGGTIKGSSSGVYVYNGANISGGIANRNLITGTGSTSSGVYVYNNANIAGGISNANGCAISGGYYGAYVNKGNISGGISNNGTISGRSKYGTYVYSAADISGGVTNKSGGVIHGGQYGTFIYKGNISGGLSNATGGTISGGTVGVYVYQSGNITNGLNNAGDITGSTYGLDIYRGDITGGFTNSGSTRGGSSGLYVQTGNITGGVTNKSGGVIHGGTYGAYINKGNIAGGITNEAGASISGGDDGLYVYNAGNIAGSTVNRGTIKGGNYGIYAYRANMTGGLINDTGGVVSGGNYGVSVRSGHMSSGLTNRGTIVGQTGGIYIYKGYVSGGITNEDGGTIDGGTGLAIYLQSPTAATPLNLNGGRIIGDVTDSTPTANRSPVTVGGNFKTSSNFTVSSVTVDAGKTLDISSGDTFTANHMNPSAGGTIAFMVTSHNPGGAGKLVVNGAGKGIDLTGMTVSVDVAANPMLTAGDALLVGDGVTAIVGGPGAVPQTVTDNSFLWNFKIVNGTYSGIGGDNTQLYLLANAQPYTGKHVAAAAVLSGLTGTTDPQLSQIINNLGAASSSAGYDAILSSVQPDVSGVSFQSAQGVMNKSFGLVTEWLNNASAKTGMSSGNALSFGDVQGWVQGFGGHAVQGTRDATAGYRANTGGVMLGADTGDHYDKGKVGLAVSYARTSARACDATRTDTDIDSYQLTAYGEWKLSPDTYIRGMAAYVRGNTDTARHDVGGVAGLNAYGNFASDQYTTRVTIGRGFAVSHALTLTPNLLADWTHYVPQDYTETGAGGADLHVTQKSLNTAELVFGLDATWRFKYANGSILSPAIKTGYRYDLIGDNLESTSAFTGGGTAFTSPGPTPARGRFNLSPQVSWQAPSGWSVTLGYGLDHRQSYTEQSGFLRFETKF